MTVFAIYVYNIAFMDGFLRSLPYSVEYIAYAVCLPQNLCIIIITTDTTTRKHCLFKLVMPSMGYLYALDSISCRKYKLHNQFTQVPYRLSVTITPFPPVTFYIHRYAGAKKLFYYFYGFTVNKYAFNAKDLKELKLYLTVSFHAFHTPHYAKIVSLLGATVVT